MLRRKSWKSAALDLAHGEHPVVRHRFAPLGLSKAGTMKKIPVIVAALLASVAAVSPSFAADEPTTIKVALLDISATMGMTGRGMMGGPMMQNGWGQGQNQSGWMGHGMMGPGMMLGGMMSIRIDRPTVKAGAVRFDVTNWSK